MTDVDVSQERSEDRPRPQKKGMFARVSLFFRQTVAELRKVIWPTRKELIAYTTIVIVFVGILAAIIAGFDYVFTKGVLFVFG